MLPAPHQKRHFQTLLALNASELLQHSRHFVRQIRSGASSRLVTRAYHLKTTLLLALVTDGWMIRPRTGEFPPQHIIHELCDDAELLLALTEQAVDVQLVVVTHCDVS
jgi:hypothetical protein